MNQYKLVIQQFILKEGCEQLAEDFYDYKTEFLLLPSFYTNNIEKIELPHMSDKHAWTDSSLSIGAGNTRELQPIAFDIKFPDFKQLSLRLNLIQSTQELSEQEEAIEELLIHQSGGNEPTTTLNSIQLIEATLPVSLLQLRTTLILENKWLLLQFELKKND